MRDRRMRHELEVSCLLSESASVLEQAFPRARFILVVRDCYSWLDSILNTATAMVGEGDSRWLPRLFSPEAYSFSKHDSILEAAGLYPLDAYLSCWARANRSVLDGIPKEKLLIVPQAELSTSGAALAAHLGIAAATVVPPPHRSSPPLRLGFLQQLDRDYLTERADLHCGPLMRRLYPKLGIDDVDLTPSSPAQLALGRFA